MTDPVEYFRSRFGTANLTPDQAVRVAYFALTRGRNHDSAADASMERWRKALYLLHDLVCEIGPEDEV